MPFTEILQPLENLAEGLLKVFHNNAGLSWGTSIIALTVLVRTLLLPLTYRQIRSMRRFQELQPQIKQLQEKFKNDGPRQQQEIFQLLRQNKANPLGSCLPMALQLPVLFALYRLLRGDSFKHDVKSSDESNWFFVDSVVAKPHGLEAAILMGLFVASAAFYAVAATHSSSSVSIWSPQFLMMLTFALGGIVFVPAAPAGLSLYWITTNIWSGCQAIAMSKLIPASQVAADVPSTAVKVPPRSPKRKKRRRR
jgi:YidC/Oxa1 family membrane protein insertase